MQGTPEQLCVRKAMLLPSAKIINLMMKLKREGSKLLAGLLKRTE
jgi:hypothetical protein